MVAVRWLWSQGARHHRPRCLRLLVYAAFLRKDHALVRMLMRGEADGYLTACKLTEVLTMCTHDLDHHRRYDHMMRAVRRQLLSVMDDLVADEGLAWRLGTSICYHPYDVPLCHDVACRVEYSALAFLRANCNPDGYGYSNGNGASDAEGCYSSVAGRPVPDHLTPRHWERYLHTDPLSLALDREAWPLVLLLLSLGCRVTQQHRRKAAAAAIAAASASSQPRVILDKMSRPHALQTCCMATIRRRLRQNDRVGHLFEDTVQNLCLPRGVKETLRMDDLRRLVDEEGVVLLDGQLVSMRGRAHLGEPLPNCLYYLQKVDFDLD